MTFDPLLLLAVVTVVGLLGGRLARRCGLASVTGQILAGLVLGSAGLGWVSSEDAVSLAPVTHFSLGLITLVVGGHLNLRRLRGARTRLGLLLLAEVLVTPLLVYVVVVGLCGQPWELGLLLAAVSIATAPATVVALVAESRSRGVFVKTLMGAVALNNMACIFLFEMAHMSVVAGGLGGELSALELLLQPLTDLAITAAIGGGLGVLLILATRRIVQSDRLATASLIAVLMATGLAQQLEVSSLLASLFMGMTLANLTPNKDEIVESAFVDVRAAIFAVFFTLAGVHLHVEELSEVWWLVLAVFAARATGKILGGNLALRLAGATEKVRRYIGMALVPQAGVAVGLILVAQDDPGLAEFGPALLTVGLGVVALNEILGPPLVRHALKQSGDAGQDRARLIDFLHEENILVDLTAATKEEAIELLVDALIRTNHLDADRKRLLQSVLEREAQISTCFGGGLAVPHGILETGKSIVGAMGISREGLNFDSPDGRPVHCIVVLATPENERSRHLQVLAALARAVGTDQNVQRQLFNAASPAHAYEILHTEEAQSFNYFLDDD
ncbi:MAG: PTS system fructose-specific IIC component [Pseudohongiellaceae bacterium]|jgi:PTS system fructose-specific IIC component